MSLLFFAHFVLLKPCRQLIRRFRYLNPPPLFFQSSYHYGFVLYPQLLDLGFQIRDQEMMVSRVGNFALRYGASFLFHSFYSRLRNIGKNSPSWKIRNAPYQNFAEGVWFQFYHHNTLSLDYNCLKLKLVTCPIKPIIYNSWCCPLCLGSSHYLRRGQSRNGPRVCCGKNPSHLPPLIAC